MASGLDQYENSWVPFFKKDHKYDGYCLLVKVDFEELPNDGDSFGLSVQLPNGSGKDASGFGFARITSKTYIGISYWLDGTINQTEQDDSWLC